MFQSVQPDQLETAVTRALRGTPARLLVSRAGTSYGTATKLELRADHAAARDAVHAELDLRRDIGKEQIDGLHLFIVSTLARTRPEYLLRPDLGRSLSDEARAMVAERFPRGRDVQIVIGDGLSARAVAAQVPGVLSLLIRGAAERGWTIGRSFAVSNCRVGVMNHVGELLDPRVVVLLIGERPGLATAESLSAYMAYRPRAGHTDARRNLISNIHARGISHEGAVRRILALADTMMRLESSGVEVKESLYRELPLLSPSDE